MAIETFNRTEIKYLLTTKQKDSLLSLLSQYMDCDKFNKNNKPYTICNLYLDTPADELIIRSLEKPIFKEKIRLRSYGPVSLSDTVFLESKKKYNKVVNKRRSSCSLEAAYNYFSTGALPICENSNLQVLKEIDHTMKFYNLKPKVFLSYDRFAFFEKNNSDFRVTIDQNIQTRRHNLDLQIPPSGTQLLEKDQWLLEAKAFKTFPLWFVQFLSEKNINCTSFSKYGTEYKKYIGAIL